MLECLKRSIRRWGNTGEFPRGSLPGDAVAAILALDDADLHTELVRALTSQRDMRTYDLVVTAITPASVNSADLAVALQKYEESYAKYRAGSARSDAECMASMHS